jgi:hypothetical protein
MAALAYRVRHWGNGMFELKATNGRRGSAMPWVAVPTKHDGKGFLRLMNRDHTGAAYGCWVLLLAVAAKCPVRGILADDDGPLTIDDIAIKTRTAAESMRTAIDALMSPEVGWIEQVEWIGMPVACHWHASGMPTGRDGQDSTLRTYCPSLEQSVAGGAVETTAGGTRADSVFRKLKPEHLSEISAMQSWLEWQSTQPDPVLKPGDPESLVRLVAAADIALKRGKKPVAYMASLICRDANISLDAMKAARKKLEAWNAGK